MAELTSYMYLDVLAFGNGSRSLKGRGEKPYPLRLSMLNQVKKLSGMTLTWDTLAAIEEPWGNSNLINYDTLQAGWTYQWNPNTGVFLVTDQEGAATIHAGVFTLSELGISWDILSSEQFSIVSVNLTGTDAFLLASPVRAARNVTTEQWHAWRNTFLTEGVQHAVFSRVSLTAAGSGDGDYILIILPIILTYLEIQYTIAVPRSIPMEAINLYPTDLIRGVDDMPSDRQEIMRDGVLAEPFRYLMIAFFAQNLLSADGKIVYEPWMLYAIFQWYVKTVRSTANARKIFDLSPRWG